MEEELNQKMKDFMSVLDQVKKYRALIGALPDIAIIVCLAFVGAFAADVWGHLSLVFLLQTYGLSYLLSILFVAGGLVAAVVWGYRKMKKVKTGEWKPALSEGAPGAIKLLQDINWAETFKDIRYAKLGFWIYGILRTGIAWILAYLITLPVAGYLSQASHISINLQLVALLALALVLALSVNDFRKRFDQIGRLDTLLWELRWMDHDFRRNPFQT
jgi:hypothetical protein